MGIEIELLKTNHFFLDKGVKLCAYRNKIMERMQRGVAAVRGEGGYTGKELRILYSVIAFNALSRFKEMIRNIDSQAFIVVAEIMEVMGKGIANRPHW